jgi:shikimate dehydrogenase
MRMDAGTGVVGLIGHPVGHSKSPEMMNRAFRARGLPFVYLAFDVSPQELETAVRGMQALGFRGWNVTIPHKVAILEYLDEVEETAREIGAVNTVVSRNGRLIGYNTDSEGYLRSLVDETGLELAGQRVLILGAGGAARAVAHALAVAGVESITIANRTREKAERLAASLGRKVDARALSLAEVARVAGETTLLVQTTSVGMYPETEAIPIDPSLLHEGMTVSDLIYRPRKTLLLREAEARGARVHGGLGMLLHQAALAFEKWMGRAAPVDVMRDALEEAMK